MESESVDLDKIFDDIRKILLTNGWDRSLLTETLESRYKTSTNRELSVDCMRFGLSVDDFIVRSEIFRLFIKNGKTHVYLAPEKLEEKLPPTVPPNPPKRIKRRKKRQADVTVVKFKANPWGTFEPVENGTPNNSITQELKPRPAFDMYSDEEEECELVETPVTPVTEPAPVPPITNITQPQPVPCLRPLMNLATTGCANGSQRKTPPIRKFNVPYKQMQAPPINKPTTYISTQQIDGPTMLDFQEVNNPGMLGLQDLSLYESRQNELRSFNYNHLPGFWNCINFRGPRMG